MDIAIVTGAEAPLGLKIVQTLIRQGCRVHGIGNNFSKVTYADSNFYGHAVDLSDIGAVAKLLEEIIERERRLDLLIHAVDVTPGTRFERLPVGNLEAILKIGLLGPVMMTRLALPNLLRYRGQLINVITANKNGNQPSAANALIEGGLREMNRALFDQARDEGLRATNCIVRQNTELPGATVSDDVLRQTHIDLEDVARTIEFLVDAKAINVPEEVTVHPRLSASAEGALPETPLPLDSYSAVVLPPKDYCPPEEPKIPTAEKQKIERTIPYSDEEMEDKIAAAIEDFEAHPERYEKSESTQAPTSQDGGQAQDGQGKSKRRRRRRGGRNRNKTREEQDKQGSSADTVEGGEKPADENRRRQNTKVSEDETSSIEKSPSATEEKTTSGGSVAKDRKRKSQEAEKQPELNLNSIEDSPAKSESAPKKKAAKKGAKKKTAAKKSAKKKVAKEAESGQPPKKTATKKAAKKAAKKKSPAKKTTAKKATKKVAKKKVADSRDEPASGD